MTPQFQHDCPKCKLIGQMDGLDVYTCTDTLVGRRSDDVADYFSLPHCLVERVSGQPFNMVDTITGTMLAVYNNHLRQRDEPHSRYAQNVIDRGPEVIGRELDRLQKKIGEATRALREVSTGGMLKAKRILES